MITVRALGSIGKTLGQDSFIFNDDSMMLIILLRKIFNNEGKNGDFSGILSELIIAINGVAVSTKINEFILKSGDKVTLIPISHGG
jgi:molybdopterin converting factor small subunit|tara:strand:+ start:93 stop:350 length:258 start_codon:yes stop_codon:yes gene_type:complete